MSFDSIMEIIFIALTLTIAYRIVQLGNSNL